jgi:hypothetical protein
MIERFGFSVGDFIALINLTTDIISSLKGRGGAIDAFEDLLSRLEGDRQTLRQLQSISLLQEYAADAAAITRQLESLYTPLSKLFNTAKQYEGEFTWKGAKKFIVASRRKPSGVLKT